jgi:hypothetical protein
MCKRQEKRKEVKPSILFPWKENGWALLVHNTTETELVSLFVTSLSLKSKKVYMYASHSIGSFFFFLVYTMRMAPADKPLSYENDGTRSTLGRATTRTDADAGRFPPSSAAGGSC